MVFKYKNSIGHIKRYRDCIKSGEIMSPLDIVDIHKHMKNIVHNFLSSEFRLKVDFQKDNLERYTAEVSSKLLSGVLNNTLNIRAYVKNYLKRKVVKDKKKDKPCTHLYDFEEVDTYLINQELTSIMGYLDPKDVPLFYFYLLDDKEKYLEVLTEEKQILFKYISFKVLNTLNFSVEKTCEITNLNSLTNFLALSKLSTYDPKLPILPSVIGENNFLKMLMIMEGKTLKFPNKKELKKLIEKIENLDKRVKSETFSISEIKKIVALDVDELKFNYEIVKEDFQEVTQSMLISYFNSIFTVQNSVIKLMEGKNLDDTLKLKAHKQLQKELRIQERFLKSIKGLFNN